MKKIVALILLLCGNALANEAYVKYGLGVFQHEPNSLAEIKMLELGYQRPIWSVMTQQYSLGGWADQRHDLGRKSGGFAAYSLGVTPEWESVYFQALWGVAGITNPDSYLGGYGQFKGDLCAGAKDMKGVSVGVCYSHLSSAGIFLPNKGRDFTLIRMAIPW